MGRSSGRLPRLPKEGRISSSWFSLIAFFIRKSFFNQRDNYHLKFIKGVKSTLTKARVKKLNSLGFDWTREGGDNDLRRLRTGPLHHRNDPEIWSRRFQEVVEYKRRFGGKCNFFASANGSNLQRQLKAL